jgi:hypothetical protein
MRESPNSNCRDGRELLTFDRGLEISGGNVGDASGIPLIEFLIDLLQKRIEQNVEEIGADCPTSMTCA